MERLQYGEERSLEDSCRSPTLSAGGNRVHSSVLPTDRLRAGHLAVVAGYHDLQDRQSAQMG